MSESNKEDVYEQLLEEKCDEDFSEIKRRDRPTGARLVGRERDSTRQADLRYASRMARMDRQSQGSEASLAKLAGPPQTSGGGYFDRTDEAIDRAREQFQHELDELARRDLNSEEFPRVVDDLARRCVALASVLRMTDEELVTVGFDQKDGLIQFVPLDKSKAEIRFSGFVSVKVVAIQDLPTQEAIVARGRMLGQLNASEFSSEHQSMAARALSAKMTSKQRIDRARKAAQARWGQK